jgi:hypothetical protein
MKITFDKKWFNPLYFILNDLLKNNTVRTVLVYGGKSSSKTVSIAQILAKELVVKNASSIAFRKESSTIPTTLKKTFNLAIDSLYLSPAIERQDRRYITKTGAEIPLKGIDNEEKAKGVESYKYLFLDELNHFEIGEYEQFQLSLRGIKGQKIFAAWNPVDENSWVKMQLVDKYEWIETDYKLPCENSFVKQSADGSTILIKTTYEDNYWIAGSPCGTYGFRDNALIEVYNALKERNYNSYRVNVLGEWGKTVFGGEFLKSWKSEVHVGKTDYDPSLAVWLSFDENVNPYFPCGVFQVSDENEIRMIDCIALKNPDNTVKAMGRAILQRLRHWKHNGHVYVCGDSTSQKDDVKQEKGFDLFRLLINELDEVKPIRRVAKSNPNVRPSADFFNAILAYNEQGISFTVDETCRVAILDFENTKEDKNGKVDKKTVTDPVTKVSYQPYGHIVDLTRYLITSVFPSQYARFQTGIIKPLVVVGRDAEYKSASRF